MIDVKNLFMFSGTISGLTYFLRSFGFTVMVYFFSFLLGYAIGSDNVGWASVALVGLAPSLYVYTTTVWKRCNALFNDRATLVTVLFFMAQLASGFLVIGSQLYVILMLGLFIFQLIMWFKNSNIEEHNG